MRSSSQKGRSVMVSENFALAHFFPFVSATNKDIITQKKRMFPPDKIILMPITIEI